MVRENRIKSFIFPSVTVTGSVIENQYTNNVLNGEVVKLRFEGVNSPGSLWLAESGVNIEVFRRNDFAASEADSEVYPWVYVTDALNAPTAGSEMTRRATNNILYWAGSGFTSGATTTFGPITVYYQ